MRIASFNINGIRARLPRLVEWLEERRPTVACLQEIKCQDDAFPAAEFEAIGYKAIWHGQKGFNGVAILAKGGAPLDAEAIALQFRQGLKVRPAIRAVLVSLARVGEVSTADGGRRFGRRFTALG